MEYLYEISTGKYLGWANGNELLEDQAKTTVKPPEYDFMNREILRWTGTDWEIITK